MIWENSHIPIDFSHNEDYDERNKEVNVFGGRT